MKRSLRQGLTDCFVGGHPMAGSEKTGYENATDHLLENAYYIVTPPEALTRAAAKPVIFHQNMPKIATVLSQWPRP